MYFVQEAKLIVLCRNEQNTGTLEAISMYHSRRYRDRISIFRGY